MANRKLGMWIDQFVVSTLMRMVSSIVAIDVLLLEKQEGLRAPSRFDQNTLCSDISQMNLLLQQSTDLVNSNGNLTPAGAEMGCDNYGGQCIRFVLSIRVHMLHYRVPLGDVILVCLSN
jgi:hypothetical protein